MTNQIFEITQSPVDNNFRVWMTKTAMELGIVPYSEYNRLGQPVYLQATYQTCVGVFKKKPTTTEVLTIINTPRRKQR